MALIILGSLALLWLFEFSFLLTLALSYILLFVWQLGCPLRILLLTFVSTLYVVLLLINCLVLKALRLVLQIFELIGVALRVKFMPVV